MSAAVLSVMPRLNGNGNHTVTESGLMNAARERGLITRFQKLVRDQNVLDYDRAVLAKEIRDEFMPGDDGDFQFRLWIRTKLGLRSNASTRLNNLARAITLYPARADWDTVGGSGVMIFLAGLTTQQRNRVFSAVRRKVTADGKPMSGQNVRTIARKLGVPVSTSRGPGKLRQRFDTLAEFIRNSGVKLPENIRELVKQ